MYRYNIAVKVHSLAEVATIILGRTIYRTIFKSAKLYGSYLKAKSGSCKQLNREGKGGHADRPWCAMRNLEQNGEAAQVKRAQPERESYS